MFEIGGESSKYIRLDGDRHPWITTAPANAPPARVLSSTSRRCACSTRWRKWAAWCAAPAARARIAGRCSVFAKSDMIHAQQKGYQPAEILRGLCDAVARNFKGSIVKGRKVEAPVALIGAVSQNAGVTGALREAFNLRPEANCSSPSNTPGAAPSAPPFWKRKRRASARSWRFIACASTIPKIPVQDSQAARPPTTSSSCATAWASTHRRPMAGPSRRTWDSISARFPPTWWPSTNPAP